ncbi:MAG: hypothetical protein WCT39_02410 [Candidatus Margulisiibacteriota bacterium]
MDRPLNPVPLRVLSILCFVSLMYGVFITFNFYGLIGFLLLIVAYLIYGWRQSLNPEGYAKGIADTQMFCYTQLRKKYPELTKEEIIHKVLKSRLGYSGDKISNIIEGSKNQKGVVNFKNIMLSLIISEYKNIIAGEIDPLTLGKLMKGLDSAIKEDFLI